MSVDIALERLRAANPVPDPEMLADRSNDVSVLLPVTWQRSTSMTQTTQRPVEEQPPERTQRSGYVVALVAAVIVIVGGIAAVLLTTSGTIDQTPVTQVPVTEAPVQRESMTDAEAIARSEELIGMFNDGEVEGLAGIFDGMETVEFGPDTDYDPMWASGADDFATVHKTLAAANTAFLFETGSAPESALMLGPAGCKSVPSSDVVVVSCRGSIDGFLFGGPEATPKDAFVSVEFASDGTVVRFSMRFVTAIRDFQNSLADFFDWLGTNHSGDMETISVEIAESADRPSIDYPRIPVFTEDGSPLLRERVSEWLASLG